MFNSLKTNSWPWISRLSTPYVFIIDKKRVLREGDDEDEGL